MRFYIEVRKESRENANFVYYTYHFHRSAGEYITENGKRRNKMEDSSGLLKIDKRNGDVYTLELAFGDESGIRAQRASWALIKHWKQGEFPEKSYWAS